MDWQRGSIVVRLIVAGICAIALARQGYASLVDWGVTPGGTSFNTSLGQFANWVPGANPNPNNAAAPSSGADEGIVWVVWDGYGPHGNATVGDHGDIRDFGGMRFDVKAMYARTDGEFGYIGVVTGFNPAGVVLAAGWDYRAGDLAINPDLAGNTAEYGILHNQGPAGTTGTTKLITGGTWNTPDAEHDPPPNTNYAGGGTEVAADILFAYTDTGVRYYDPATKKDIPIFLYEYRVPLERINYRPGESYEVFFGISCQNDSLVLTIPPTIPEPSLVGAAVTALAGLAMRRRRRKGPGARP